MFRASMCPSSGENYCIYASLVFVTVYGWRLVCWLDWKSNQQTVFLTVHPCIISLISATRWTILLNIFIYLLYMFRASMCPSSGENYCICATLVFVTLYGWRLVCWLDFIPTNRPDATHTEWQIPVTHRYSNFLLMMGTWMPETCREEK